METRFKQIKNYAIKVKRWIEEATILDEEITEHSSQLMRLNKRIEVAENQAVKKDLEYDIIGIQYHLFTAQRHREEFQQNFEANCKIFLQLRDEEERFGLVSISESDEADDLRKQAEEAERSAEGARKELDAMLGKWVNDVAGAREGETCEGEVHVPLDLQFGDLVEEGLHYPDDSNGWSLSGPTGDVIDSP